MVAEKSTTDGRIARRERNEDAVLDAVVNLFESGNLDPAVEDVSGWSGVSTRSIYRYFHHRDGLINAALWHLVSRVDREIPLNVGNGSIDERIARFVEHRLRAYERLAPLMRASLRAASPNEAAAEGVDDGVTDRSVFSNAATECFVAEFSGLPSEQRRHAEVATEMALQFESLEFLTRSFDGDRSSGSAVLVRPHEQQLSVPI
jgi:AcrR family transcriptional regulator